MYRKAEVMLIGLCRSRRDPNIEIMDISILELLHCVRPELHIFLTSQKGKGSGSINTVYLNTEQWQLQQAPGPLIFAPSDMPTNG